MSQKRKNGYHAMKILEDSFSGSSYSFRDSHFDRGSSDGLTCFHAFVMMWLVWYDLLGIDPTQLNRLVRGWIKAIPVIPVDAFCEVLAECDEIILHCYNTETDISYAELLHSLRVIDDRAGLMLAPIRTILLSAIHNRTVESLRSAHQALMFISRLTLVDATESLVNEQVRAWMEEDSHYHDWDPESLRPFFMKHFRYFTLKDAVCKHGPGTVYECVGEGRPSLRTKYTFIYKDCMTHWLDVHIGHVPLYVSGWLPQRKCRLLAVPKNARKRRIITVEPATLVWYQQGVRNALDDAIRRSKYLSRHIAFEKPELNSKLAQKASLDGSFATIDLSSASDSITFDALRRALPSHLFTALACARSNIAEDENGNTIQINKFAGMGNATTFAVESLYFAAIVEQGIVEAGGDPVKSLYRVYGDDIIVETRYCNSVMMCLDAHGFRINRTKTFTGQGTHIFRESCGGEYLDGESVVPLKLSRGFRGLRRTPGAIQGVIDMCNRIPSSCTTLRLYLISWLKQLPQHLLPYLSTDGKGLHVVSPDSALYPKRYSHPLQTYIIRHGDVRTSRKSDGTVLYKRLKRPNGRLQLSTSILYVDGISESVRYYEYLKAVRKRTCRDSLTWPEDLVIVDIELPDKPYWGSTSVSDLI